MKTISESTRAKWAAKKRKLEILKQNKKLVEIVAKKICPCGKEFGVTVFQLGKTYCSSSCYPSSKVKYLRKPKP